ncbi:autotransporter outer membrane beta-barrel domain-containing protein [Entomomonas sp. E2T0]|uniref:autotransporter outer membrane beta-barrel domain-containing protein n=1 Tax=Entomomonas sp. E2T0 TaxID=2930213 RepID=UPI00222836C5|nr:autotransporter outer membrane beta-barrel domain-containing protein [Entomomonas sp. E2T0]UYZ83255.1 autotransporter outer membrane beta-barrel domain-containing protein [Entomomonas sp. E2T0]
MIKPSILSQTISVLSMSFVSILSAQAADCTVTGLQVSASTDCQMTDDNLTMVSVNGAKVTHTTTGDLVINNPSSTNGDFSGWAGQGTYGVRVSGAGAEYILNSATDKGDIEINTGTSKQNQRGRGITVENGGTATIYANKITVNTLGDYKNDWNANNAIFAGSNGTLNIFADELNLTAVEATVPYGTIGAVNGTVNIKGNTGLSMTNITTGGGGSSAGIFVQSGGHVNLELINIVNTLSNGNYGMGIYTADAGGASVTFVGGDITTQSRAGSGIRSLNLTSVDALGYDNGHFNITTTGMDARGIRSTGQSVVTVNSEQHAGFVTTITTSGSISDGLNAGRLGAKRADGTYVNHAGEIGSVYSGSEITVYGEAHITTQNASSYGLRLIGDGATINLLSVAGQGRSTVHSKSTAVRFGFGNGYSNNADGTTDIKAQTMTLESVDLTHDGTAGSFVLSNTGAICNLSSSLCDTNGNNTWASGNLIQVGDNSGDVGRAVDDGRNAMTVADAVVDGVLNLKDSTATAVTGRDLLNVTFGGGTTYVPDKVSSSFTLNADSSVLKGSVSTDTTLDKDGKASVSTLNLTNNTEWYIERDSNVTNLTAQNSKVYLNTFNNWSNTTPSNFGNQLTVNTLAGNGHFFFNTDIVAQQTDKLIVTDINQATGSHLITVKNDASQATNGTEVIDIIETEGGSANFSLYQGKSVELGQWEYGLRRTVDSVTGQQNGNWQLYATPRRSSTAQAFNTFVNTNYMLTYIDIQTLLQRMGELRDTEGDGDFWMRGFAGKLNTFNSSAFDGYDMHYRGTQAGIDKLIKTTNQGRLYVGGMVGYIDADQDFRKGSGSAKNYHLGLYTTYITNDDLYFDGVVKYAKLKNSFNVKDSQGTGVTGTGNTNAISLSGEIGKRFYVNEGKQGLYIEPQAQLVYTYNGSDSTRASNDLKVKFNNYDSLIGRGSAVIGYQISNTENPVNVYFKTGYVREFKGKVAYKVNDTKENTSFRGGWFENAVGVSATINKNHNVYGEVSYSNGNRFDKQQLNVGYRYSF